MKTYKCLQCDLVDSSCDDLVVCPICGERVVEVCEERLLEEVAEEEIELARKTNFYWSQKGIR